jgi:hypothetical protein
MSRPLIITLPHAVELDPDSRTLRPVTDIGEEYFGVAPLTNGTAAACRRECVGLGLPGFQWVRRNRSAAIALSYVVP